MRKRELLERLVATENLAVATNQNYIHATERLAEIELSMEDVGWIKLGGFNGREFSRTFLNDIYDEALTSYIKNPLTNHGVKVQGNYVFGQGLTIKGESDPMDKLWQLFWNQPANRVEFTSHQSLFLKEVDLQLEGNLFLALFTAPKTGAVKIRSILSSEIVDIITNPEDSKEPWYYHRRWYEMDMSGQNAERSWTSTKQHDEIYPAWNYRPRSRPTSFRSLKVNWDAPIYHVKVGGTSHMRYGVTEVYSSLDWSRAYKNAMENYATVLRALSMFAHQLTTKGGKEGVAEARAKLNTTFGDVGDAAESRPSPLPGSTFVGADGVVKLEVLKTSGAQANPGDARPLVVLAGAGLGTPYSILTGDADKSNLATAKSLDRPTELSMGMRQKLWTTIFQDIATYLLWASIRAPRGVVKGKMVPDEWGTEQAVIKGSTEANPIPTGIIVTFPPILEHDVGESVDAIVSAATLDGKPEANILDKETLITKLASTLGIENIDVMIEKVLSEIEAAPPAPAEEVAIEAMFIEALKEVQTLLKEHEQ